MFQMIGERGDGTVALVGVLQPDDMRDLFKVWLLGWDDEHRARTGGKSP
jgi:hypothetical protein